MKLATFRHQRAPHIGVLADTGMLFDLTAAESKAEEFASMLALIDAGPAALERAAAIMEARIGDPDLTHALDEVNLLAPLPEPRQMRDFSVFPGHIRQAPAGMQRLAARRRGDFAAADAVLPLAEVPAVYRERPIYYITNRFGVAGPGAPVFWPGYSDLMDFELEFGIVLGKAGRDIPAGRAGEHIFGYTIYNDFSARDTQNLEMQGMLGPAKGKSFDGGNVLGPYVVTPDEVPDPYDLKMSVRVNGETWSSGSSAEMLFTFEDMIAYVSRDETLHAGEFFGSGTMGNGSGLELDRFLNHGDLVEIEVERLGVLSNRVFRQAQSAVTASSEGEA